MMEAFWGACRRSCSTGGYGRTRSELANAIFEYSRSSTTASADMAPFEMLTPPNIRLSTTNNKLPNSQKLV